MNKSTTIPFENFCTCLELWKGCLLAGIFSMSTSIFDLLWSVAHMIEEENVTFFYLLFVLGIESVLFIFITGVLFVALVKKSKCLLLPWLLMAAIDVILSLVIAFAELALPNRTNGSSCSLPVISTLVSILVCVIMLYCGLVVFAQYVTYSHNTNIAEIKVTPVRNDSITTGVTSGQASTHHHSKSHHPLKGASHSHNAQHSNASSTGGGIGGAGNSPTGTNLDTNNTLKVPQITTPKDAW